MTRNDIIRMAREAQSVHATETWTFSLSANQLERFAALVATFVADRMIRNGYRKCAEGQRTTQFCGQLESAVAGAYAAGAAAERGACAALLEANGMRCGEESLSRLILETNAAAIRARNP